MRSAELARSSTSSTRPRAPSLGSCEVRPRLAEVLARARSSSSMIFSRVSERTRAISASSSTGLVRKSSAPHSSPRNRSAGWSSAVTMTTGRCIVAGSALRRVQTSKPSMPGIMTSSRTMSARPSRQSSRASGPLVTETTSKYSAERRASRSLMLGSRSSTIKTRAVI